MEWVETTGRSVEEAKEAALDELGVDEQDAEFEIVAEARLGLFGRLRSEARVRARVMPTAPRAKGDRRRKRRRPGSDDSAESADTAVASADAPPSGATSTPAGADGGAPDPAPSPPGRRTRSRAGSAAAVGSGSATSSSAASAASSGSGAASPAGTVGDAATENGGRAEGAESGSGSEGGSGPEGGAEGRRAGGGSAERPRPRRNRGSGRRPVEDSSEQRSPAASAGLERPEEDGQVEVALEEQAKVAEAFLQGLVVEMGVTAEISIKQDGEESVELNLDGPELGLLIGPKGTTLLALQDLTRTVVQRKTAATNGRLWVDVSGYRQKRSAALARFAKQVASEVLASGTRKAMEPMNAADRKVVHDTVNEISGVATLSEGEDAERRVVVYATTE